MAFTGDFFDIKDKEIVIFGVGQKAKSFYDRYSDILKISYFTSNDKNEKDFYDLKRIEPDKLMEMDHIFMVVCSSMMGACSIESQLSICFTYGRDYIDCELFDELYIGKRKLILVVGLCHELLMAEGLKSLGEIAKDYIILYYWHSVILGNTALRHQVNVLSAYADYQIVMKLGRGDAYTYLNKCENRIVVPYPTMQQLYPQINWVQDPGITYMENSLLRKKNKLPMQDIRAFHYTDLNVVKLVRKGLSVEQVLEEISQPDFYQKDYIDKLEKSLIMANLNGEKGASFTITDYIEKNYIYKRLCLDGVHFDNSIIWEFIRRIVSIIDNRVSITKDDETDLISQQASVDAVWANETPMYPSIWKNMHIEWVDDNTEYKMITLGGIKKINFHDYMYQYIEYVKYALEIERIWQY